MTPACGVEGCEVHIQRPNVLSRVLFDASDPGLRVGMGGRLPGPSQASLGSPDWVASFAVTHPMWPEPVFCAYDHLHESEAVARACTAARAEHRGLYQRPSDDDDDTAARRKAALQRRG